MLVFEKWESDCKLWSSGERLEKIQDLKYLGNTFPKDKDMDATLAHESEQSERVSRNTRDNFLKYSI